MWSSKRGGGTYGKPWNRSSWNQGGDSISVEDRNHNSTGEREIKFPPVNNFSISVPNDVAANNYRSSETTEPSDWVFGQTEWSRLWASKCFQSVAPAENPKETNPSPSIRRSIHSESPLPRGNNQNQPDRVARLSCWGRDNRNECEEKVSIKSRLGNGGGPIRSLHEAKVRRDRSVPIYGQERRIHSDAPNSQKEYGSCRIRRSPPHVVPSPRGAVRPSDPKAEAEELKEWDMRHHLRKLRFEKNATVTADLVSMALDDLIAVKKNVKNSKKTSPLGKASYSSSGDPKINDEIIQLKDRRSFNSKLEQPVNRLGKVVPSTERGNGKLVIVDGSSVAFDFGDQIYFDWEGINVCVKRLTDFGHKRIKVVVPEDKLGKGMSKNNHHVEGLQKKGFLLLCRENQNYKQVMLNIACKKDAIIVSNDVGKKTMLPGSGAPKDAVERTSRFSFKARGPSKSIAFAKLPNGLSLGELLHH